MWNCPKCGREFKNTEQSHYCEDRPKTIDEYILSQEICGKMSIGHLC